MPRKTNQSIQFYAEDLERIKRVTDKLRELETKGGDRITVMRGIALLERDLKMNDDINTELGHRTIKTTISADKQTVREILEAPLVFVCKCGTSQDINNTHCVNCSREL